MELKLEELQAELTASAEMRSLVEQKN